MSYSGKLFGVIPYDVRISDTPHYEELDIEAMLGLHYGSVSSVLVFVESVSNDDKHEGNILGVECLYDGGKDRAWYPATKYADDVGFVFNSLNENDKSAIYAHQIDYAVEKHFTHDSQLTIFTKDQIDKTFDFDLQAKVVQSAKDYVAKNKKDLDKIISSDTPGRVGILIRAHLAGIDFTPFDNPSDLIRKIEDKVRKEHAYMQEPPKGERVYDAWIQIENFRELFDKRIQEFMDRNGLVLDIYETNPQYAIRSAFEHWAMSQNVSSYKSPWEAFDVFFEKNKDNSLYFSKKKEVKSLVLIRKIENMLEKEGKTDLYEAVQNIVASDGSDGTTLAYPDESMIEDNLDHAMIIVKNWNTFIEYSNAVGLTNITRLRDDLERVTGIDISDNIVKRACKELGITQKELADKLGASEGTVRNWSSSNELPQWAINFIVVLKENQKNKEIADTVKRLISLTN